MENREWGYDRIQGALANLGHTVSDTTVGNILKKQGLLHTGRFFLFPLLKNF